MDIAAATVALLTVCCTLIPLLPHDPWYVRAFEFPRLQVTIVTLVVLIGYVLVAGWRDWWDVTVIAALGGAILFQLYRIAPYTPLYPKQLRRARHHQRDDQLNLMVANVLTPNRRADALLRIVRERDPDVVLAVETDSWWETRLDALVVDYPHALRCPLDNLYGMHLYSRLELVEPEIRFLVEDDVPSMHAQVVLRSGHRVQLHCVHPAPPSPSENETSAERDAELLIVAKTVAASEQSAVVMGDLNDVAWSRGTRLFQRISGLLDPRIGRGMFSTFHASYPFLRWPLDHMFCSSDFSLVSMARLGDIGSDHFPMQAVLQHTPHAASEHAKPEPDAADHELVEEKIDKVDADEDALR